MWAKILSLWKSVSPKIPWSRVLIIVALIAAFGGAGDSCRQRGLIREKEKEMAAKDNVIKTLRAERAPIEAELAVLRKAKAAPWRAPKDLEETRRRFDEMGF